MSNKNKLTKNMVIDYISKQLEIKQKLGIHVFTSRMNISGFDSVYSNKLVKKVNNIFLISDKKKIIVKVNGKEYHEKEVPQRSNLSLWNGNEKPKINANLIISYTGFLHNKLCLFDVDNKDNTLELFNDYKTANSDIFNTHMELTINGGFHFLYYLNDSQHETIIKPFNDKNGKYCTGTFRSSKDKNFMGMYVDISYDGACSFGPSIVEYENKIYTCKIINEIAPIEMPDKLFQDILKCFKTKQNEKNNSVSINNPIKSNNNKERKKEYNNVKNQNEKIDTKLLKSYLDCLNINRFIDRDDWMKVGFLIYNMDAGFELFDEYSAKAGDKYHKEGVVNLWNSIKCKQEDGINIGTLKYWAKKDNLVKFKNICKNNNTFLLNDIFTNGITDVSCAKLFFNISSSDDPNINDEKYVCDRSGTEDRNVIWYRLNDFGIYEKDHKNIGLQIDINSLLLPKIDNYFSIELPKIADTDENKRKLFIKHYNAARKYLRTNRSKIGLINELSLFYIKKDIADLLNSDKTIIAFNNGIYDSKNFEFRPYSKRNEFVSVTTGYDYNSKYNCKKIEVMQVLTDIIGEDNLEYTLSALSYCLFLGNIYERYFIWKGKACNGKTKLRDFLQFLLGGYFGTISSSFILASEYSDNPNAPTPEIAKLRYSRCVFGDELDEYSELNTKKIKMITGRGTVPCCKKYCDPFSYKVLWILFLITNDMPQCKGYDKGIKRRQTVQSMTQKFVQKPSKSHHRLIDENLDKKMETIEWRISFFHILVEYFKLNTNLSNLPTLINHDTVEYLRNNDPIGTFLQDCIVKCTPNDKISIRTSLVFNCYKKWCSDNNLTSVDSKVFTQILIKKNIKYERKGGYGKFFDVNIKIIDGFNDKILFPDDDN